MQPHALRLEDRHDHHGGYPQRIPPLNIFYTAFTDTKLISERWDTTFRMTGSNRTLAIRNALGTAIDRAGYNQAEMMAAAAAVGIAAQAASMNADVFIPTNIMDNGASLM